MNKRDEENKDKKKRFKKTKTTDALKKKVELRGLPQSFSREGISSCRSAPEFHWVAKQQEGGGERDTLLQPKMGLVFYFFSVFSHHTRMQMNQVCIGGFVGRRVRRRRRKGG